jgi:hypothetical protein
MSKTKRNEPYKERKPLPPRSGHYHQDKKKADDKKAARKGNWDEGS